MSLCKECGIAIDESFTKEGYCKNCKPELFTEEEVKDTKIEAKTEIISVSSKVKKAVKKGRTIVFDSLGIASVFFVVLLAYFFSDADSRPKDSAVINIASQYSVGAFGTRPIEKNIKIVNHYKREGEVVYILNIDKSICEMSMIQIRENWKATGVKCSN